MKLSLLLIFIAPGMMYGAIEGGAIIENDVLRLLTWCAGIAVVMFTFVVCCARH